MLLALDEIHAALLGQQPGVDQVDAHGDDVGQHALDDAGANVAQVVFGQVALCRQFHVAHALRAKLAHEAPHAFGKVDVRNQEFQILGRNDGRVDRIARRPVVEHVQHLQGDILGDLLLRLHGAAAQVRREHDLRVVAQRAVGRQWFLLEDIQRGAGKLPCLDGFAERLLVDDAAARDVDDARGGLHARQPLAADEMARLRRERHVQREKIRPLDQRVEIDQFDVAVAGILGRDVRVVGDNAHAQPLRPAHDLLRHAAQPDGAEHLAAHLDAHEAITLP